MSDWKAKRFWKEASVVEEDDGFAVVLDGRSVKTPAKTPLVVPTEQLAQQIAAEWDAQVDEIDPLTMPVTRRANAALDKVARQHAEVAAMIAEYGESDLLCYRATGPIELVARQTEHWDPLLEWAASELDAQLTTTQGVMHIKQSDEAIQTLSKLVHGLDNFQLTGFYDLVSISGSLILALAVIRGRLTPQDAWSLSRLDDEWQIEQWGRDEEAEDLALSKESDFVSAAIFYKASVT